MSLPSLYAVPTNPTSWKAWSFSHAANHYDWIAAGQAKQATPTLIDTSALTSIGSVILTFSSTSSLENNGQILQSYIADITTPSAIPNGTLLTAANSTEVQMSQAATSPGVGSGDQISFTLANPVNLQQFILDPMDLSNLGMWNYNHAIAHQQANELLGTSGYNLLSYDLTDPEELREFISLNGDEHRRISTALGVG